MCIKYNMSYASTKWHLLLSYVSHVLLLWKSTPHALNDSCCSYCLFFFFFVPRFSKIQWRYLHYRTLPVPPSYLISTTQSFWKIFSKKYIHYISDSIRLVHLVWLFCPLFNQMKMWSFYPLRLISYDTHNAALKV